MASIIVILVNEDAFWHPSSDTTHSILVFLQNNLVILWLGNLALGSENRTTVFHVIDLHFWRLGNGKERTDYSTIRLTSPFNSSQVKYFNVKEMTHRTVTKKTYLAEFFFFQSPQCRHVAAVTLPTQSRVLPKVKISILATPMSSIFETYISI